MSRTLAAVLALALALPAAAAAEVRPQAPRGIGPQVVHAEAFGARGDGVTVETKALQAAIDAAAARHGTLVLKPGTYLTGGLFLKSGMALRLDKGVRLLGAQTIDAYERRPTRVAGIEMTWPSALLNVYRQSDVRIYGEGVVDGNGKVFWDHYWDLRRAYTPKGLRWASDYDAERPRLIQVFDSHRVELGGGLTLTRSGFWTVHVVYSDEVKVSGVVIRNNVDGRGPSTDGVDIDSSRDVLVENADIDNNDDALCLKAGRDADGLRVNRPTEHVLIRNSIVRAAAAGVTFGSETSGGIHDVEVYGIKVVGPVGAGILLKSAHTRGGTVSEVDIHDMDVSGARNGISVELNWNPAYSYAAIPADVTSPPSYWKVLATPVPHDAGLPHYRDVTISRIRIRGAQAALNVQAYPDAPIEDFRLDHLDIEAQTAGRISHARGLRITDSRIVAADGRPPLVQDAVNLSGL